MRPDHLPARRPAARPGFTLVELLVVIIIVAVIAGLAIPAVMRAQSAARNAAIKSEIDQLHMAIMNYKNEYGSFPPCIDPVGVGGPVHKHLQRVFPRTTPANLPNVTYLNLIKPDSSLVFWLGGFSDDPTDPLGISNTSLKRKKLFDFDQSRVVNNTFYPTGKAGSPYVYIPSSQYALSAPPTGSPYTIASGSYFAHRVPIATNAKDFANVNQPFFNADTFQILCAGRDEKFGTDDDLSNFWPGTRLDYIDSVK